MGWKGNVCVALFLSLNLLSLSIVTSQTSQPCPNMCACVRLLKLNVTVGSLLPPSSPCCSMLRPLGGSQAAACLCNAARDIPDINEPDIAISLNTTLTDCGFNFEFRQCP